MPNLTQIFRAVLNDEITLSKGAELVGMRFVQFRRLFIEWSRRNVRNSRIKNAR